MRKAFKIIAMCVALIVAFSLCAVSAFADTTNDLGGQFEPYIAYVLTGAQTSNPQWIRKTDIDYCQKSGSVGWYQCRFGKDLEDTPYYGFRLGFIEDYAVDNVVSPGHYAVFTIVGEDTTMANEYISSGERYFKVWLIDKYGNKYEGQSVPQYLSERQQWISQVAVQVGEGLETTINEIWVECDMPSSSLGTLYYDVYLGFQVVENPTEAQRIHEETLEAIQDSTDQITGSIGDAADDIIANENANHEDLKNGWEAPGDGDPAGDMNNMTDDLGNAENEALGGKTDEEIQAELGGVLATDNLPSVTSSGMVSVIFDKLLMAFGNEYMSLLMLSLILGLASFLVGRQYRARGD